MYRVFIFVCINKSFFLAKTVNDQPLFKRLDKYRAEYKQLGSENRKQKKKNG